MNVNKTVNQKIEEILLDHLRNADKEVPLPHDVGLANLGLSDIEIFDFIVSLEDFYAISFEETDSAQSWDIGGLANLVRQKLRDNTKNVHNWKDSYEILPFSGQVRHLRTPLEIHLDATFRCNMRCVFCYDSSGTDHGIKEMSLEEIQVIIDECSELDVAAITFGGGEPFIRKDFVDILRYAKSHKIRCLILTNGSLITREIAQELSGILDMRYDLVQVSIDGPTAEVHEQQRGVIGSFDRTWQGVRYLQEVGIQPVINSVLTRKNAGHIEAMLPFLIENGISSYRVLRLHPLGRGRDKKFYKDWQLTAKQSAEISALLNRKRDELIGQLHISDDFSSMFYMNDSEVRSRLPALPGKEPVSYACGAGTTKIAVAPDSSVYPCSYMYDFPELRIGSLRKSTISKLWNNDELWDLYREPLKPTGKCKRCEYLHNCKTGCRIVSYALHGDMAGPDAGCYYEPAADTVATKK